MREKRIRQINSRIVLNRRLSGKYFRMLLEAPEIAGSCLPGQFVHMRISKGVEPLLRRPFSIHRVGYRLSVIGSRKNNFRTPHSAQRTAKTIEILYEVVGKGTEILSRRKRGGYLDIIGPLGNGFNFRTAHSAQRTPILVAGGIGLAPLTFLAEKLARRKAQSAKHKTIVLLGTKTKSRVLCYNEFKKLGCEVKIATEDGSGGFKGKVTELLRSILLRPQTSDLRRFQPARCNLQGATMIYACGPQAMLKEIAGLSQRFKVPSQLCFEQMMGCGIGACLGCVIKTEDGYRRICQEGPVFNVEEICWQD